MKNTKVVYTSLVGDYDNLLDPEYVMKGWDYLCFSNDLNQKDYKVWKIVPIEFIDDCKIIKSRHAKLLPHYVLKDYEYSFWQDANIVVKDDYIERCLNKKIEGNFIISIPKHPENDCIYKEAEICLRLKKAAPEDIERQISFLKSNNYPAENGLFENNLIFRKHNSPEIKELSEAWWDVYLEYTKRDQLSLSYLLEKYSIDCPYLIPENENIRKHDSFTFMKHRRGLDYWNKKLNKLITPLKQFV